MQWTWSRLQTAEELLKTKHPIDAAKALNVSVDSLVSAMRRHNIRRPDPVLMSEQRHDHKVLLATNKDLLEQLKIERRKVELLNRLAQPRKPIEIVGRERNSGIREMTALLGASDWHVEETVDPVKVQGRNKFTLNIADLRIHRFFRGAVRLIQHHRASKQIAIRDVLLWLGGDLITGHIHEEMLMTSALSPIEALLWLAPRLKAGISYLLDELDLASLTILCDIGNHGRTTKFRHITTGPETSYEWGLYCQLAREFAGDKRIKFDTSPANDHYAKIYGYTLHTTHGDSLKYAGGVGGLTIPLLKAVANWDSDIRADWHMIGHFHTMLDVDKAIANGSLIGWGAYSKWIKCKYNPRDLSQHFSLVDKQNGRCHSTPIWVSKRSEELRFWSKEEKALCSWM